jgi:hypothetical protein
MGKLSGLVVLAIQTLATAGIFRVTFSIVLRKNGGKPARRDTVAIEKLLRHFADVNEPLFLLGNQSQLFNRQVEGAGNPARNLRLSVSVAGFILSDAHTGAALAKPARRPTPAVSFRLNPVVPDHISGQSNISHISLVLTYRGK